MVSKEQVKDPKWRILMEAIELFVDKGFKETTIGDIAEAAEVTASQFKARFRTKDGVLYELIDFMFDSQFALARSNPNDDPVFVYALETAIQLSIAEKHEHIRELYLEAYSAPRSLEFIRQRTAKELHHAFKAYNPSYEEIDFYECEIGTSGLMKAYMGHPCSMHFPLKTKVERFLQMALKAYNVPESKRNSVIASIASLDLNELSAKVLGRLFDSLESTFHCRFTSYHPDEAMGHAA